MKVFRQNEVIDALECVFQGGQALRLIPPRRDAELYDRDIRRLAKTAKELGVKNICIERAGTARQHVDLSGEPLRRAKEVARSIKENELMHEIGYEKY